MAKSSADDQELRRACEAAIEGTKQKVLLSIRVAKSRGVWGKSGKFGRQMAKPRVLAVCVDAVKQKVQHSKAFLRVFKYSTGGVLEGFDNLKNQAITPPQWTMRNIDDRNRVLLCILNVCKDMLGRLPKVVGIDVVEMALWAKENTTPSAANQVILEDGPAATVATERDLKAVHFHSSYVMGIGEAEAFSERLKREVQALEAANVHAILETEPLVEEISRGLDSALSCLDDMDEWLRIFNVKLRHMREDIESIETRNNQLEMQSVNNTALIEELDKLLERLHVPSEYAACLTGGSFDEANIIKNIEACEWLSSALRGIEVPSLDPVYSNMRAQPVKPAWPFYSFLRALAQWLQSMQCGKEKGKSLSS
ncbi:hypothetical protein Cgig2_000354 [Carnegiea gigantea]|uniref:Exocyst complex component Sec3 coiled-coil domain-containing protein n=1 Tax=Carnegiea gigantea TaxID=171969 RepID=A0A9Q1KDZ5_9CARY|nr:hypothetical protein Cgig2_000354 [Carnegiea gigantea]